MHVTSERSLDGGIVEREFAIGEIPGVLWTPASASAAAPVPPPRGTTGTLRS